jgi:pilus assembly protein CpaF
MIALELIVDGHCPRRYSFESQSFSVGHRSGCDIRIPPKKGKSKTLSELRVRYLEDDGVYRAMSQSRDVLQNGRPLPAFGATLSEGDEVMIAGARLRVLRAGAENAGDRLSTEEKEGSSPLDQEAKIRDNARRGDYLLQFLQPIRTYLSSEDVSEVMVNGPEQVYIERGGLLECTDARFVNEEALQSAVKNIARHVGRQFDAENPRLDARLPDGSRIHAVMPPMSRCGTVLAIRRFSKDCLTMDKLVEYGSISAEGAALIEAIVRLHKNILVSGPTSSGKTSVLNVLSAFLPDTERILVIEDASELQLDQQHLVRFETRKPDRHGRGEVTIRDLVHSSLRLRPDRLIIGEIRGGEALDLLQALNTGHAGSMSTIHANGPLDALVRLETCALMSGADIPQIAVREQVAAAVDFVIHTARLSDGSRKIMRVTDILPLENGAYRGCDLLSFEQSGQDENGRVFGRHRINDMSGMKEEAQRVGVPLPEG